VRTLSDESLLSNPSFMGCKTVWGSYPTKTSGGKNRAATRLAEKSQSRLVQRSIVLDEVAEGEAGGKEEGGGGLGGFQDRATGSLL